MTSNSLLRRLAPCLLLAATLFVAACQREAAKTESAAAPATAADGIERQNERPAAPPVARTDARLALANNSGQVRYDGVVDSAGTRERLLAALQAAYGTGRVSGEIAVDPATRAPDWLDNLPAFARRMTMPGAALTLQGRRIELSGSVSRADRAQLLDAARTLFPGYTYAGLLQGLDPADATRNPDVQALASLRRGASPTEVVATLNRAPLRFQSESAALDPASLDVASRAADALKAAPAGTRVEIAGPVQDTGDAAADRALSEQRAQALKVQLIVQGVDPASIQARGRTTADADAAAGTPGQVHFQLLR